MAKAIPTEPPDGEKIAVFDTDDIAIGVKCRTARIALVDRSIDLNEVVIGAGADIATTRGYDAGCNCAAETEGIADGNDPIADTRRPIRQFHIREWSVVHLDQRKISARIGADHLGLVGPAIIRRDLNAFGLLDHVIVGHCIAVSRDEKARSLARNNIAATTARHTVRAIRGIGHSETPKKFAQARRHVVASEAIGLRSAVDLDPYGDHRGFDLLDDVSKADRRLQLASLLGEILCNRSRVAGDKLSRGATTSAAAPRPAIVVARSTHRRDGKRARLVSIFWSGRTLGFIWEISIGIRWRDCAPFRTSRWGDEPYSVLSAGLNFCKVWTINRLQFHRIIQRSAGLDRPKSKACVVPLPTKCDRLRTRLDGAGARPDKQANRPAMSAAGGNAHRTIVCHLSGGLSSTNSP